MMRENNKKKKVGFHKFLQYSMMPYGTYWFVAIPSTLPSNFLGSELDKYAKTKYEIIKLLEKREFWLGQITQFVYFDG